LFKVSKAFDKNSKCSLFSGPDSFSGFDLLVVADLDDDLRAGTFRMLIFLIATLLFLLPDFVELPGHSQQLELRLLPREGGIQVSHPTLVLCEARFFHFAEI
jgi:hypothetical protein